MPTFEHTTHERTTRIPIPLTATRPPGRAQNWTATVIPGQYGCDWFWVQAPTEKGAVDDLTGRLATFLTHYRPPVVLTYSGHTAVVSMDLPDADGLGVTLVLVRPDGSKHEEHNRIKDWADAVAQARYRLADAATDWHDDASVNAGAGFLTNHRHLERAQNLRDYAAWQRAAKVAMAAGRDDWHQWASDHQHEFTVPPPPQTWTELAATAGGAG